MHRNRKRKESHILLWIIVVECVILGIGLLVLLLWPKEDETLDALLEQELTINYIEDVEETEGEKFFVPKPEIDEQLLTINDYSRPGTKTDGIKYVVIHYLANPRTTAQENRDYFESLKELKNVSMSANYVVGLEGEIIHCVPDDEVAYASNSENHDSISIENCHMDTTGKFTQKTYDSLVELTAYLTERYDLGRDDIIRHYDVTGKECPLYYVRNEDKWEEFKDDVMAYREECRERYEVKETDPEVDELEEYLRRTATEDSEE